MENGIVKVDEDRFRVQIRRFVLPDGTFPKPEDVVGFYCPVTVLDLDRFGRFYILIFIDDTGLRPRYVFAQFNKSAFKRVLKKRFRLGWMRDFGCDRYKNIKYIGQHTFISDNQMSAEFEFFYNRTWHWERDIINDKIFEYEF